jgi:hypothetical protein
VVRRERCIALEGRLFDLGRITRKEKVRERERAPQRQEQKEQIPRHSPTCLLSAIYHIFCKSALLSSTLPRFISIFLLLPYLTLPYPWLLIFHPNSGTSDMRGNETCIMGMR